MAESVPGWRPIYEVAPLIIGASFSRDRDTLGISRSDFSLGPSYTYRGGCPLSVALDDEMEFGGSALSTGACADQSRKTLKFLCGVGGSTLANFTVLILPQCYANTPQRKQSQVLVRLDLIESRMKSC